MKYCPNCGIAGVEGKKFCPQCGQRLGLPEQQTETGDVVHVSPQDNGVISHTEPGEDRISGKKQRHGCLTAYLIFAIIVNAAVALYYVFEGLAAFIIGAIFVVLLIFNIICFVALFKWKKWGFWGVVVCIVVGVCLNLYLELGPVSFSGLIGLGVLYGVLHIGEENKGWPQLD